MIFQFWFLFGVYRLERKWFATDSCYQSDKLIRRRNIILINRKSSFQCLMIGNIVFEEICLSFVFFILWTKTILIFEWNKVSRGASWAFDQTISDGCRIRCEKVVLFSFSFDLFVEKFSFCKWMATYVSTESLSPSPLV